MVRAPAEIERYQLVALSPHSRHSREQRCPSMVLIILAALALILLVVGFTSIFRTDKLLVDAPGSAEAEDRPSRQPEHRHRASRDRQHDRDPRNQPDDEFFFSPRPHIYPDSSEK